MCFLCWFWKSECQLCNKFKHEIKRFLLWSTKTLKLVKNVALWAFLLLFSHCFYLKLTLIFMFLYVTLVQPERSQWVYTSVAYVLRYLSCLVIFKSIPLEVFLRKGVLKICSKFKGERPRQSVLSIKLLCNFIEIALRHGCSPVNLLHILRTPFPKNTSGGLLLKISKLLLEIYFF